MLRDVTTNSVWTGEEMSWKAGDVEDVEDIKGRVVTINWG